MSLNLKQISYNWYMPRSLFLKTISALMLTLFLIILVLAVRFFVHQKVHSLENLATDLATKKQQEISLVKAQQQYKQTTGAREELDKFNLKLDQIVLLIESLESIAKQAGVVINLEHVGGNEGTTFIVKGSGSFSAIYRLIGLVETMPYPVFIESSDMAVSTDDPRKSLWTVSLTLRFII